MADLTRTDRLAELLERYPVDPELDDVDLDDPFRYAAVKRCGRGGDRPDHFIDTFATVDDAVAFAGDEILAQYPWVPEAVVDLDTGEPVAFDVKIITTR